MNVETNLQCSEDLPWRWSDKMDEIRLKVQQQTPEYLDRFNDLTFLRARLLDLEEIMEAFAFGSEIKDLFLWGVFDPIVMNSAISTLRSLPTVPADLKYYNIPLPDLPPRPKNETADDSAGGSDKGDEAQEAVSPCDPWSRKIEDVRTKWSREAPQRLKGLEDLVKFRSDTSYYVEAIESSILGYDPEDPYPEAAFGDSVLEGVIEIMGTLPRTLAELGLETGVIQRLVSEAQAEQHGNDPDDCNRIECGGPSADALVAYCNDDLDIAMIETGESHVLSVSLDSLGGVILNLANAEPATRVASIVILGGGPAYPFWVEYYDSETDTLLLGTQQGSSVTVRNGDIAAYWQARPEDAQDSYVPLGIEVFQAKKWLGHLVESCDIPRSTALKWKYGTRNRYSDDVDTLYVATGQGEVEGKWELAGHSGTFLFCGTEDGHDIVSIEVPGASAILPLGLGYDAETDTLTIGETTDDPARVIENGDFVGYWAIDSEYPDNRLEPIGVALRRASEHLAQALRDFKAAQ